MPLSGQLLIGGQLITGDSKGNNTGSLPIIERKSAGPKETACLHGKAKVFAPDCIEQVKGIAEGANLSLKVRKNCRNGQTPSS
jgi:hypothetical protein